MADKKEFHFFVLPEYEEEEKYLCDMAKKGNQTLFQLHFIFCGL